MGPSLRRWFLPCLLVLCGVSAAAVEPTPATGPFGRPARRWALLPGNVHGVCVDAAGRPWFSDVAVAKPEDVRASLTEALAGKEVVVHGEILLVDRRGTVWVHWQQIAGEDGLIGFDGHEWVERGPLASRAEFEAIRKRNDYAHFHSGWEGLAGDVFFLDSSGIHRRGPDGSWEYQPLDERNHGDLVTGRNDAHAAKRVAGPVRHVVAADGSVYVWRAWGRLGVSTGTTGVLRFDGKAWRQLDPRQGGFPYEQVGSLTPMPDGSLAIFTPEDPDVLHFWGIGGMPEEPARVRRIVRRLAAGDRGERDTATEELVAVGPPAAGTLRRARESTNAPEVRARLAWVLTRLKGAGPPVYGGRFACEVVQAAVLRDRSVLLSVRNCEDRQAHKRYPQASLLVSPEGRWELVTPGPTAGTGFFQDRLGRMWTGPFRSDTVDFSGGSRRLLPEALKSFYAAAGPDEQGRMYLSNGLEWAVFDEAAPQPVWPFAADRWATDNWATASDDGTVWAWLFDAPEEHQRVKRAHELLRAALAPERLPLPLPRGLERIRGTFLGWVRLRAESAGALRRYRDGAWALLPGTPVGRVRSMMPLKNGGVLVVMWNAEGGPTPNPPAALFDGEAWDVRTDLRDVVASRQGTLLKLAGSAGPPAGALDRVLLDAVGNFWVLQAEGERFTRFDGKEWVDVAAEIRKAPGGEKFQYAATARLFDGGKALYVPDGTGYTVWLLSSSLPAMPNGGGANGGGGILVKPVPPNVMDYDGGWEPGRNAVVDHDGALWVASAHRKSGDRSIQVASFDAAPRAVRPAGWPMFCDRDGRLWFGFYFNGLRFRKGPVTATVAVYGASMSSRMAQTPDGRLFAFHRQGLSEIQVEERGGGGGAATAPAPAPAPSAREVSRWQDGLPLGEEGKMFFSDAHGALWLLTEDALQRIVPPGKQW